MVIVHIAHLDASPFGGVNVAVPQHVREQQQFAQVGFVNLTNLPAAGVEHQFPYDSGELFSQLPEPFDHPDIIVFHEIYRPAFLKLSLQARKQGVPYVVFPHGGLTRVAQKSKALKKLIGNTLLFNRFLRGAAAIQCVSQRELDECRIGRYKFLGTNGIKAPGMKSSFSEDGFALIYIGRLDIHIKGLDLLLEALHGCREELVREKCHVDLYGPDENGSWKWLEEKIRELNLEEVVFVHPGILGEAKSSALCAADCYIQTSRTEGMSMGILEAQAAGIPCIVTEGTGMTRLVQEYDSGWSCPTTSEGIGQAVMKALEERGLLPEKSAGALKMINENFAWEHIAQDTVQTYRMLSEGK